MGGAKFLGASVSMPRGKIERAFECFFYWMAGGMFISFALTVVMNLHGILAKPNFLIPIGFYFSVGFLLFCRYLYYDFKGKD